MIIAKNESLLYEDFFMAMYMLFEWKVIQNVVFKIVFAIHLKTYMN